MSIKAFNQPGQITSRFSFISIFISSSTQRTTFFIHFSLYSPLPTSVYSVLQTPTRVSTLSSNGRVLLLGRIIHPLSSFHPRSSTHVHAFSPRRTTLFSICIVTSSLPPFPPDLPFYLSPIRFAPPFLRYASLCEPLVERHCFRVTTRVQAILVLIHNDKPINFDTLLIIMHK